MNISLQLPTRLDHIREKFIEEAGLELWMKRDDLIHPIISGNKWRKLKYNLYEADRQNKKIILSFGGAYSNHIHALAAAGMLAGFRTIGVIRGEQMDPLNPTLEFAKAHRMNLEFINRKSYAEKDVSSVMKNLRLSSESVYFLPEGGTNSFALPGCAEIISEINMAFNYICCPCGSAGTLAGMASAVKQGQTALGFSILNDGGSLNIKINDLLKSKCSGNWMINREYVFGGYAKFNKTLIEFIDAFEGRNTIKLEPIYTGKMMFGLFDLIKKGFFKRGERIIALHSGGLQGLVGLKDRIQKLVNP